MPTSVCGAPYSTTSWRRFGPLPCEPTLCHQRGQLHNIVAHPKGLHSVLLRHAAGCKGTVAVPVCGVLGHPCCMPGEGPHLPNRLGHGQSCTSRMESNTRASQSQNESNSVPSSRTPMSAWLQSSLLPPCCPVAQQPHSLLPAPTASAPCTVPWHRTVRPAVRHRSEYEGQLEYDIGNLMAFDPAPLDTQRFSLDPDGTCAEIARGITQVCQSVVCSHSMHCMG